MKNVILPIENNNKNFYIYKKIIDNIDIDNFIKHKEKYIVLILSNDLLKYNIKSIENFLEIIIKNGCIGIFIYGDGSKYIEEIADNIIINFYLQNQDEKVLNIITVSEKRINEIDGFIQLFINWSSICNFYVFTDNDNFYHKVIGFLN